MLQSLHSRALPRNGIVANTDQTIYSSEINDHSGVIISLDYEFSHDLWAGVRTRQTLPSEGSDRLIGSIMADKLLANSPSRHEECLPALITRHT